MATTTLVKPVTCRRCSGKGILDGRRTVHAGIPGGCFACAGAGEVEGDKATKAAAKARLAAERGIITWAMEEVQFRGMEPRRALALSYGIDRLATTEPARFERALDSYRVKHPGLLRALVAYTAAAGFFRYGTRAIPTDQILRELGL